MSNSFRFSEIILASSSPRRRELLGFCVPGAFRIMSPDIEEKPRPGEDAASYSARNAREKAQAVFQKLSDPEQNFVVVLSADTIVVLNGQILEKPVDKDDAFRMLSNLSGKEHEVITAFTLQGRAKRIDRQVFTKVMFRELSEAEINRYIATGDPMDKAGAYAAQGHGGSFIRSVDGSYTNVIGLPLAEVMDALHSW